jgi:hypothetical protein
MSHIKADLKQMKKFFNKIQLAGNTDIKEQLVLFLEGSGEEFLRIIQDEIMRKNVMDTRLLLISFSRGSSDGIWELNEGNLKLEIGTNVNYASYVNDGHWTCKRGESKRFVPGVWQGGRFQYISGAKTGMVLKQRWVEGAHYWETAIRIFENVFPIIIEQKTQQLLNSYLK